jgi:hypothetical protein
MAYVYQLNEFAASGGRMLAPVAPRNIAVPKDLDPGSPDDAATARERDMVMA